MSDLPVYMQTKPDEFYKSFTQERRIFSDFAQSHIRDNVDVILREINVYVNSMYPSQVAVWVGGSRSWNMTVNCNYNTMGLSTLEHSAIVPGNYDIFVMANDMKAHSDVLCKIKELISKYTEEFRSGPLGTKYQLYTKLGNIDKKCNIEYPDTRGGCTLFPCQSIMLSIKSKQYKRYTTRNSSQSDTSSSTTDSSPFTKTRSVFSQKEFDELTGSHSSEEAGEDDTNLPKIVDYKLLLYVESFLLPNVNIEYFKQALLASNCQGNELVIKYLNPMGLLMMSEFISVPRKHKGLNVDDYRKRLLMKAITSINAISQYEAYKRTLDAYYAIFGTSQYLDKYLMHTLLYQMMHFSNLDVDEQIEKSFIPMIRPYINSFLIDLELHCMDLYGNDVFFAIVGGDAMRRYDINISNTSDFDTKMFVNTKKNKGKDLENMLISKLSRFVTFLNRERSRILSSKEYTYNINDTEYFTVRTGLLTNEGQFRLRYIKKNASLPIDLFSLDYRTKVEVKYRNATIIMNVDIPFLDIAIISNGNAQKRYSKDDVVDIHKSRVVPIVTLDFLLNDLEKTYTMPTLAAARYWNNKIDKDTNRYRILQQIKYNGENDDRSMDIDHYDGKLDVVADEDIWQGIDDEQNKQKGEVYAKTFKDMMKNSKKYKYMMRFTENKEDIDVERSNDIDINAMEIVDTEGTDTEGTDIEVTDMEV